MGETYNLFNFQIILRFSKLNRNPIKSDSAYDTKLDKINLQIYKEEVKQFVQRKMNLHRNLGKLYNLVWGHCNTGLQAYIKNLIDYKIKSSIVGVQTEYL